jgi:hypothetical protein
VPVGLVGDRALGRIDHADDDIAVLADLHGLDHVAAGKAFGIVAAGCRPDALILGVPEGEAVTGVDVEAHAVRVAAVSAVACHRDRPKGIAREDRRKRDRGGSDCRPAGRSGHGGDQPR